MGPTTAMASSPGIAHRDEKWRPNARFHHRIETYRPSRLQQTQAAASNQTVSGFMPGSVRYSGLPPRVRAGNSSRSNAAASTSLSHW